MHQCAVRAPEALIWINASSANLMMSLNLFAREVTMLSKTGGDATSPINSGPTQLFQLGKERTDAMLALQKELLDEYQQASQAWLARVKSELDFWSALSARMTSIHSVSEGVAAYSDGISQRMQMAVEDGRRIFDEGQKLTSVVTRLLNRQTTSDNG
jgi:Phasin protein